MKEGVQKISLLDMAFVGFHVKFKFSVYDEELEYYRVTVFFFYHNMFYAWHPFCFSAVAGSNLQIDREEPWTIEIRSILNICQKGSVHIIGLI